MKTLEQILKTKPVYLHDWSESKRFAVIMDFEDVYISEEEYKAKEAPYPNVEAWIEHKAEAKKALAKYKNVNILFATYTYENYSGDAFVLFEEKGKLYEVNGSHCSCYGLEGQWSPEEVSLKELEHRLQGGTFGEGSYDDAFEFKKELAEFLGVKLKEKEDERD